MFEVCIDSLESAINAINGGAEELEVCSSLSEGGLTPSAGLVKCLMQMAVKPKINVMIRCRTGSDFCYNDLEMDTMMTDLEIFKAMGVDRFVFGALNNREIDEDKCLRFTRAAHPVPVTFHRAFDMCKKLNVDKLVKLGFSRILTSGQKSSAAETEAIALIKNLLQLYGDKIEIMPGAGITIDNVKTFIEMGCKIVHSSCKTTRNMSTGQHNLSLGTNESSCIYVTDKDIVSKMKEIMNKTKPE